MVQCLGYVPNNLKLYFLIIDSLSKLLIPVGRDMKLWRTSFCRIFEKRRTWRLICTG